MEIDKAKSEIIRVKDELSQVQSELARIIIERRKIVRDETICENRKKELNKELKKLKSIIETENMFESVQNIEGFNTLSQNELIIITNGMDKTNYESMPLLSGQSIPRWYDLERLVTKAVEIKQMYPNWILEKLSLCGQYDTLPPKSFYKFCYKTPQGSLEFY